MNIQAKWDKGYKLPEVSLGQILTTHVIKIWGRFWSVLNIRVMKDCGPVEPKGKKKKGMLCTKFLVIVFLSREWSGIMKYFIFQIMYFFLVNMYN